MNEQQTEQLHRKLIERSEGCERGIIAAAAHPTQPDAGAGIALADPNCVLYTYTPGRGLFLDFILN